MPAWVTILVSFLASFIGAISGALLTIFANEIIFKPVLTIDPTEDRFFDHKTQMTHHRITVRNVGWRTALHCTASLELHDLEKHHLLEPDENTIVGPESFGDTRLMSFNRVLHWAGIDVSGSESPISISINKQSHMMIDICMAKRGLDPPIIFVFSEKPGRYLLKLLAIGGTEFKGNIDITASNANPREVEFRLSLKDEGNPSCPTDVVIEIDNIKPKLASRFLRQFKLGQ